MTDALILGAAGIGLCACEKKGNYGVQPIR